MMFTRQFDFSNNQTAIHSCKLIDFPGEIATRDDMPGLFDNRALP